MLNFVQYIMAVYPFQVYRRAAVSTIVAVNRLMAALAVYQIALHPFLFGWAKNRYKIICKNYTLV